MAVTPTRGSPIGAVSVGTTDDFFTDDLQKRLARLSTAGLRTTPQSQVIDKDGNVLGTVADFTPPPTTLDKVMALGLRSGGISDALSPLGDAIMGRSSNLGILPLSPMTGDRDTIGGELLQGLGNIGLAGLEGLRRTAETVSEVPFALGRGLGTESESAYMRRMRQLASDPRRPGEGVPDFVGGSLQPDIGIDDPRSPIAFGPSYQQTPTDVDQDAAIRSQIRQAQDITEEQGIFGDTRQPGMGVPDFVGGVPSAREEIAQAIAASEADDGDFTESGRRKDPTAGDDTDETTPLKQTDGSNVEGADNPVKQSTVAAINDVLRQVKPDAKPQDYDDYMKEFADLTGLDVSGQPDNSQALMAFGLALMQNKAGKGFNVGRMLSEVGAAGEKAMPALEAARKEAKQTRIKAAEFAISRKDKDEAQMLNRQQYFVLPKDGKGFASNINKAESEYLNPLELNAMVTDKAFTDKFEIIPGSQFNAIRKEAMKGTELGDQYRDKPEMVPLLAGAKDLLKVPVFYESPNYKGPRTGVSYVPQDAAKRSLGEINRMNANLNRAEDQIVELVTTINSEGLTSSGGAVTIFDQTKDGLVSFGRSIGVDFGEPGKLTKSQKIRLIFDRIQAQYAPQILQEAGKTISDADRARVEQIVGGLDAVTSPEQLTDKIRRIHEDIIGLGRANVQQAYNNLQDMTDYDISKLLPRTQTTASQALNEDERKELEALRKKQGIT
tara:strand:- start:627 stop:2798 length:2172 start_codon:yes stop_codon:yes gene_type:complete